MGLPNSERAPGTTVRRCDGAVPSSYVLAQPNPSCWYVYVNVRLRFAEGYSPFENPCFLLKIFGPTRVSLRKNTCSIFGSRDPQETGRAALL